jgi:acetyl esterase/lipase
MILTRTLSTLIGILLYTSSVLAEERPNDPLTLWPHAAPGALGKDDKDIPTLTPYWAETSRATGAAFVVCPGGGYNMLAPHEGEAYARWLNDLGIHALVLKYRLVKDGYHLPEILQDAARSVRLVRAHAKDWSIDPDRIGIIGSSAGGHLAATLMTRFDAGQPDASDPVERASSQPNLGVLCYAFILFDRSDKSDRQERFLGAHYSAEQVRAFSPALNVTKHTPPCFVWQTVEDTAVVVENSLVLADALRSAGVSFELHLYEKGRHGIGLGTREYDSAKLHPWANACALWLRERGYAVAAK